MIDDTQKLEQKLIDLVQDAWFDGLAATSFEDEGILTPNNGIVLKKADGTEFLLIIVQSKRRNKND